MKLLHVSGKRSDMGFNLKNTEHTSYEKHSVPSLVFLINDVNKLHENDVFSVGFPLRRYTNYDKQKRLNRTMQEWIAAFVWFDTVQSENVNGRCWILLYMMICMQWAFLIFLFLLKFIFCFYRSFSYTAIAEFRGESHLVRFYWFAVYNLFNFFMYCGFFFWLVKNTIENEKKRYVVRW